VGEVSRKAGIGEATFRNRVRPTIEVDAATLLTAPVGED